VKLPGNDLRIGGWYDVVITVVIPVLFAAMIVWWFYQSVTSYNPEGWWNPFHRFSLGTCLLQWGVVVLLLILFNRRVVRATHEGGEV